MIVLLWAVLAALASAAPAQAAPIAAAVIGALQLTGAVAAVSSFLITTVLTVGASWGLGQLLKPKAAANAAPQDRQASVVQLTLGETPREALFGVAGTGGTLMDAFNYGGPYGTDWEVQAVALADHRCAALIGFNIGDVFYPFVADGPVDGFNGQLEIYFHHGAAGETLPAIVTANSDWTADDLAAGVAKVFVAYKADAADATAPVWSAGRPSFLWTVKGKLCYDPRADDTAGGSGAQRWEDASTWAWSDNPAVCHHNWQRGVYALDQIDQADMLWVGRGLSTYEAPPARVIVDANLCDELVDLGGGLSEPRYRLGGLVNAGQTFIDVEQMFADAMAGVILQPAGGIVAEPGQAKDPIASFTDDDLDIAFPEQFLGFKSDVDRYNTVVPQYVEPTQQWASTSAGVQRVETVDLIADGGARVQTYAQDLVTSRTQAERNGAIRLRQLRLERSAVVTLQPLSNFPAIEDGDWVTYASARHTGGAAVPFRVTASSLDAGWRNTLQLEEIDYDVFGFGGSGVAIPIPPAPVPLDALALAGVVAEYIEIQGTDGSIVPAIRFHWTAPVDLAIAQIRAEVRKLGDATQVTAFQTSAVNAGTLTTTNGVGGNMRLEARLIPLGDPGRPLIPSAWIEIDTGDFVSSSAIRLGTMLVADAIAQLDAATAAAAAATAASTALFAAADSLAESLLADALRGVDLRGYVDQLTHIAGDSLVSYLSLIMVLNATGSAVILDGTKVQLADDGSTLADKFTVLQATDAANAATIVTESTARTSGDTALATLITALTSTVGTNTAAIATESTARANGDTALATLITALTATVSGNTADITTEATARASADSANASLITALTTTVSGHTASISSLFTSVGGLLATYSLALDVNGKISGVVYNNTGATSSVVFADDSFAIGPATGAGAGGTQPFFYDATTATLYLNNAYVSLLVANTVNTQHLIGGAVTGSVSAATAGAVGFSTTAVIMLGFYFTNAAGGDTDLTIQFQVENATSGDRGADILVYRDDGTGPVQIVPTARYAIRQTFTQNITLFITDTPGAGTFYYAVYLACEQAVTLTMNYGNCRVIEFKR